MCYCLCCRFHCNLCILCCLSCCLHCFFCFFHGIMHCPDRNICCLLRCLNTGLCRLFCSLDRFSRGLDSTFSSILYNLFRCSPGLDGSFIPFNGLNFFDSKFFSLLLCLSPPEAVLVGFVLSAGKLFLRLPKKQKLSLSSVQ